MDSIKSFGRGFASQGWDTLKGLEQMVARPVDTAEGLYHAATHPSETWNGIRQGVSGAFRNNPADASGRAVFEVAALFTPAALSKVSLAARTAKGVRAAEVAADAGRAAHTAQTATTAARVAETGAGATRAAEAGAETARMAPKAAHGAQSAGQVAKLGDNVLAGLEQLPRGGEKNFGHWASKHGPKTADQAVEAQEKLKAGKSTTWFQDDAAMQKTLQSAPDQLRDVLTKDPKKLGEFEQFLQTPKEGAAFGFRFKVPGEASIGQGVTADGSRLASDGTAYLRYQWARGEGGALSPQVFTAYPVGATAP